MVKVLQHQKIAPASISSKAANSAAAYRNDRARGTKAAGLAACCRCLEVRVGVGCRNYVSRTKTILNRKTIYNVKFKIWNYNMYMK